MKLRKKIRKYISPILSLVIFIQPLFLQSQLIAAQKYSRQQILFEENHVPESSAWYNHSNYYIDVTPSNLDGLNLKELFRAVIECAHETQTLHELPQGLINCCKALENDASTVYMPHLTEALPFIIEKMMDPIMLHMLSRAPRLDEPGTDGAFVGPLLACNIDKVVQLLNQLLKTVNECCAELELDFSGVFTVLTSLGATATCDFTAVFSVIDENFGGTFTKLNDIKNTLTTCCAQLEFDFDGTFSVLAALATTITCDFTSVFSLVNTNFGGTFTELNDIKNTLTTCCEQLESNFDGTFTVLAHLSLTAICDLTPVFTVLTANFEGTFTELNDIKNTFTACCDNVESDFDGTFTVLANAIVIATCDFTSVFSIINANFSGTFSALADIKNTLTACCNNLESDFDGTFTVLSNLMTTVTCDFVPFFIVLNTNFGGTFTALHDIKDTLTTCCEQLELDFDGTFTTLANLETTVTCNLAPLFIVLNTNFDGTFTALNDIKDTLTTCCTTLEEGFDSTFTVLAHLILTATCDFTSLFTVLKDIKDTLTTCCDQLEFNFDGTFTALANMVATAICDFTPLFTQLNDIKNTLTLCCDNFNDTFTELNDIKNTVTTCCDQLELDFDGTFTALATLSAALCDAKFVFTVLDDIKNTLTTCCEQLELDFDGTFTALANITITATVDLTKVFTALADIKNTFTLCCTEIQSNFAGTFTVLADIKNSLTTATISDFEGTFTVLGVLTAAICNPTVIRQSNFGIGGTTPLTLSTPGVYIFGENITFNPAGAAQAITITTSAVILDLKCFTLQQGNETAGVNGIQVTSGLTDVTIRNGEVFNFTRAGISVQSNNLRTKIQNVTCLLCAVRGIELLGVIGNSIQDAEIDHCIINACAQGVAGDFGILLQQGNRCKISYCDVVNCGSTANTLSAIRLDTCDEAHLTMVNVFENTATTLVGIQLLGPTRSSFKGCVIRSNTATTNLTGFGFAGAANRFNMFNNCQIVRNTTGATFIGVNLPANTNNNMFVNCNISWNSGQSSAGFSVTGGAATNNNNNFLDCVISANSSTTSNCTGFSINGSDAGTILNSIIAYNSSSGAITVGINFVGGSGAGGSFWIVKGSTIIRNTGINPANSFGILLGAGTNDFITGNFAYSNGGAGALAANQLSGVPVGSVITPPAPATSNMNTACTYWQNEAIAA
jgi:hypothetical protein